MVRVVPHASRHFNECLLTIVFCRLSTSTRWISCVMQICLLPARVLVCEFPA